MATKRTAQSSKPETETHLLIDGDILAFVSAAATQSYIEDSFGYIRPFANTKMGEAVLENMLFDIKTSLKGTSQTIVLSDPQDNWRKSIDPTYKTNRVGERPLLLDYLKDYLRQEHGAFHWEGLEADDTLGVLMTEPRCKCPPESVPADLRESCEMCRGCVHSDPKTYILVGRDKDFNSLPGLHFTVKDYKPDGSPNIREVTPWEADRFHMMQTLAGDAVDGYAGCPGIGMARAAEIIDKPRLLVPNDGVKTRGVNKGEAVTRWVSEPTRDYWACIVSHYRKAGLTEADALKTARLARILRWGEYDPETQELTLWTPAMLPKG